MRSGSRLSRTRVPQRGDLRRMSAKDYYAREEMTRGIMAKLRPLLEPGLWMKLDRGKRISAAQAEQIRLALGRIAVSSAGWPFSWPAVKMLPRRVGAKHLPRRVGAKHPAAEFLYVEVEGIRKVNTPDGAVYMPAPRAVTAAGRSGIVGFSSHAIDQWMSRTEGASRDVAVELGLPELVREVLASVVRGGAVDAGARGMYLVQKHEGEPIGYFPLAACDVGGESAWVCKTFLTPEMRRDAPAPSATAGG